MKLKDIIYESEGVRPHNPHHFSKVINDVGCGVIVERNGKSLAKDSVVTSLKSLCSTGRFKLFVFPIVPGSTNLWKGYSQVKQKYGREDVSYYFDPGLYTSRGITFINILNYAQKSECEDSSIKFSLFDKSGNYIAEVPFLNISEAGFDDFIRRYYERQGLILDYEGRNVTSQLAPILWNNGTLINYALEIYFYLKLEGVNQPTYNDFYNCFNRAECKHWRDIMNATPFEHCLDIKGYILDFPQLQWSSRYDSKSRTYSLLDNAFNKGLHNRYRSNIKTYGEIDGVI